MRSAGFAGRLTSARASLSGGEPAGKGCSDAGTPGTTFSPGSRKFPLRKTRVTRRWLAGSSAITGSDGITGRAFSSAAILSRSGLSSGAIDPK